MYKCPGSGCAAGTTKKRHACRLTCIRLHGVCMLLSPLQKHAAHVKSRGSADCFTCIKVLTETCCDMPSMRVQLLLSRG